MIWTTIVWLDIKSIAGEMAPLTMLYKLLTQVQYVHHGLQPQGVVQRHHRHGVGVAGQLRDDPL